MPEELQAMDDDADQQNAEGHDDPEDEDQGEDEEQGQHDGQILGMGKRPQSPIMICFTPMG